MEEYKFSNSTTISITEITAFHKFASRKVFVIGCIIIPAVLLCAGVGIFFANQLWGIVFMCIGAFAFFACPTLLNNTLKKFYSPEINNQIIVNHFYFYENYLELITTKGSEEAGKVNYQLNKLIKMVNYKQYLFIYVSDKQCVQIDKNKMTTGSFFDLLLFLKEKQIPYSQIKR